MSVTNNQSITGKIGIVIFFMGFMNSMFPVIYGQDAPQRVFMYLTYFQSEESQHLMVEVKYRVDRTFTQLADATIDVYLKNDTSQIKLGSVTSGKNGMAKFELKEEVLMRDADGYAHFEAIFAGNDQFQDASQELSTKRAILTLNGEIEDSIKNLTVNGIERISGEEIDISEAEIKVFVTRTYSDLPVAEGTLEDGSMVVEFPNDIPGDGTGNLSVIARIIEHDDYGTVEARSNLEWGVPVSTVVDKRPRALWSRAPLWIIIAVTLTFTAAWYHYFLSLSKLFKIRKL